VEEWTVNRTLVNLAIDTLAALLFLAMLATGYVLRFPLPPGTNKSLMLWGLTRHQWGDVHFWIGLGMLGVVLGHLVLHWPWVVSVIGRHLRLTGGNRKPLLLSGVITLGVAVGALTLFAQAAHRGVTAPGRPMPGVCPPEDALGDDTGGGEVAPAQVRAEEGAAPEFWRDVYPALERACLSCHGPGKARGEFRIDRRLDYFGKGGAPPLVVPGQAGESPLIEIVAGARADMPLANRHKLPPQQVGLLKAWIDAGARWAPRPDEHQPH
jgi:hypothetical protein